MSAVAVNETPNPHGSTRGWNKKAEQDEPGLWRLLSELLGMPDAKRKYVYLSDGGHFENMGVYELLRRRCRFILAIEAGADPTFMQDDIGNAVRLAQIDFGVRVQIDIGATRPNEHGISKSHVAVGRIFYGDVLDKHLGDPNYSYDNNEGVFIYLRAALTGDESADVLNYHALEPVFPNETTLDQFYSESQFQSYRALGTHTALNLFRGMTVGGRAEPVRILMARHKMASVSEEEIHSPEILERFSTRDIFTSLYDFWLDRPPGFVGHYTALTDAWLNIHSKLRCEPKLSDLAKRLYGDGIADEGDPADESILAERLMIREMLSVLEKAYLSLDFEHFWQHPTNRGVLTQFEHWARGTAFQNHWKILKSHFSPMFQHFIDSLLVTTDSEP